MVSRWLVKYQVVRQWKSYFLQRNETKGKTMRQHQISLSTSFKRIRHGSQNCVSCFYTKKRNEMNKKTIITILFALVAMAGQGQVRCYVIGTVAEGTASAIPSPWENTLTVIPCRPISETGMCITITPPKLSPSAMTLGREVT